MGFDHPRRRHAIGLGQCHHAASEAKQINDGQMLARLRHDAIVCCHHKDDKVDAKRARQHVVNKLLMPWHVEKTDRLPVAEMLIGKAEIDGDAACFFLGQPVGIGTGERFQERRLAVVDMPCRADDHALSFFTPS